MPSSGTVIDNLDLLGSDKSGRVILEASWGARVIVYFPGEIPSPYGNVFILKDPSSIRMLLGLSFVYLFVAAG